MRARRALLLGLLIVTGLAVQTSVLGTVTLNGTKPELLLLLTIALAMADGPEAGAVGGFVMGLATDLLLDLPRGLGALTFTVTGYAVGRVRAQLSAPSAWLPMGIAAVATFVAVATYGLGSFVLGVESLSALRVLRHATFAGLYAGLLTPFIVPLMRALGDRTSAVGVVR